MGSKWNISGYDRTDAVSLCRKGINPLTAVLLASRNILGDDDIAALQVCELSDISDPMLLKDMDIAAARVRRAIETRERVAVYGDYDVDGITASCLVADYLKSCGIECGVYIPERIEEGYGVNREALCKIKKAGATLVITVDCGITAVEEQKFAKDIGLDMVITDHHECGEELPASPVVNPKRPDCPSPAKNLAGVGVAFKLICAVDGVENTERLLKEYGDLVAVGTIADVMSVTGENRLYIQRGLDIVRNGKRPGIRELCAAAGTACDKISTTSIGYVLAPKINAAGRLGETRAAVELLMTEDDDEARAYSEKLCEFNKERQRLECEIFDEAKKKLQEESPTDVPIVLADSGWHQGVAGIVASRVAEKFHLPTVMICIKDGVGKGSCRSVSGFNMFEALKSCSDLLLGFGGHEMAAGLTIKEENIDKLKERFNEKFRNCRENIGESELKIDFEVIKPELLTIQNITALDTLEPFGLGNPSPILCMKNVEVEHVMALSGGKHTRMWVVKNNVKFETIFFGKRIEDLNVSAGRMIDIAFCPRINEFRGRRSVQLNLVDVNICE